MHFRDRIKELRRVKSGDLHPCPWNWREHPLKQREALQAIIAEVGYAGAAIARELPDGALELIDGHMRAELDPEQVIPVLVLDVNEDEARKLLATFDPLGVMAEADEEAQWKLLEEIDVEEAGLRKMLDELPVIDDDVLCTAPTMQAVMDQLNQGWIGKKVYATVAAAEIMQTRRYEKKPNVEVIQSTRPVA
jgi:hypothetical protein